VTYRYEAFAQRHVFAINHADGTYNRGQLGMAHPISSYLLRPYTTMYGYLGIAPPTDGPLYAAWNEAYMHYGVIPTLKPGIADLKAPSGFSAQFFDEVKLWQDRRVDVDMDGAWPPEIAFPFRTADGERVVRTADRRLLCGDREVSRTITGVESVRAKGSIPGWYAYDQDAIFGLDPDRWYAWSAAPRDPNAFHVAAPLPEGFTVGAVARRDTFALVRTRKTGHIDVRLAERMGDAVCGSQPFQGDAVEVHGELHASDGAMFYSGGDVLFAHPPYRTSGTGIAWARFDLELPNDVGRFMSEVALDAGAVGEGKSDGVTFRVSVKNESAEIHAELLNATSEHKPLEVDLKAFRGTHVRVELSVDPGPKRDSSYDWARWYNPRIERAAATSAEMTLADAGPWALAIASQGAVPLAGAPNPFKVAARFPGAVFLLKQAPEVAALPLDLAAAPFETTFVSDDGIVLEAPPHACAARAESEVGGVKRMGLFAHPPDHGRTCVDLPMTLPGTAAVFHGFAGIRDRAKSTGVEFIVEVNGDMQIREKILPGTWKELQCDLALWAGKPIVLSLITDAAGDYICDWAEWGEPRIVAR
jgi:hypothetical protein